MKTIVHMTTRDEWENASRQGEYTAPSLAEEGFIHCSRPEQVAGVANALYSGRGDLMLLWIDEDRVRPEIRYEGEREAFPHIYGPLNLDAVLGVAEYRPGNDGTFHAPPSFDTA